MGFFSNFFNPQEDDGKTTIGVSKSREKLKLTLKVTLRRCGFTEMEVNEVLDVVTLAETDIKIAEDSLKHVNINNPDPTRQMHAALEDIRRYQKELQYNIRKKILEILARKKAVKKK